MKNKHNLFNHFNQINISEFARKIGMNGSLLRRYKSGLETPSLKQLKRIEKALHELGGKLIKIEIIK